MIIKDRLMFTLRRTAIFKWWVMTQSWVAGFCQGEQKVEKKSSTFILKGTSYAAEWFS